MREKADEEMRKGRGEEKEKAGAGGREREERGKEEKKDSFRQVLEKCPVLVLFSDCI